MKKQLVGEEALALIEHIEETYGAEAEVGTIMLVCDVTNESGTTITYGCSDHRRWVQIALLQEVTADAEEARELEKTLPAVEESE